MTAEMYSFVVYLNLWLRHSSLIDFHKSKNKYNSDWKVHKNDLVSFFLGRRWRNAICLGQMVFTWAKMTEYASQLTFH